MSGACCDPVVVDTDPQPRWWADPALRLPLVAGVGWVAGLTLGWAGAAVAAQVALVVAIVAGAATFVPPALRRLVREDGVRRLGVGLLMTMAAAGAIALGHLGEAAALAFLFAIAEALEHRAMDRAQRGLRALLDLLPQTARVADAAGATRQVPVAKLRAGDTLIVGAGDRVATDGVVTEGRSALDTSAVTGESIPVEVGPADEVMAGSINTSGTLRLRATADGRDSSLTRIVALVEQAQAIKGDRARLADRIARPLVPLVLVTAVLVAGFGLLTDDPMLWVERALVVMVAASPCALAIAVPVTVTSAIGAASRMGVVITSGSAAEQLGTIRHVAMDKTGTLTANRPAVVAVRTVEGWSDEEVTAVAAGLEATSSHPLAAALTMAAAEPASATTVVEHAGQGVSGLIDGRAARVGSHRWIDPGPLATAVDQLAAAGASTVVVEVEGVPVGVVGVRDELRPEVAEVVAALHDAGITISMLTGDADATARALAAEAGIDHVHAELLPAEKAELISRCGGQRPTAMIGDGINDAPALASATVGIAMGTSGSAAAIESADVALGGTDLRLLPRTFAHARRTRRIMTWNIALAIATIVVLFPLALTGVLGLAAIVLVHEVAEVAVIGNGLRAARTRQGPLAALGSASGSGSAAHRHDHPHHVHH